jgi:hypothetical protein
VTAAATLESGMPTGVGSLPFDDAVTAAGAELELHPELPAAPQLPRRDARESLLAQAAAGVRGVVVGDDGSLDVDCARVAPVADDEPLDAEAWAGALAFLRAAAGRDRPLKLQLAGPITLGLALVEAGLTTRRAFAVANATIYSRLRALLRASATRCPDAPVVVVLDEPSLTHVMEPGFPLTPEETVDVLSGALATATSAGAAVSGVHACGRVDWSLTLHAGPDLVSLPTSAGVAADAAAIATFLDRGGWIAWGVVPTDRPIGNRYEAHWQRLNDVWKTLTTLGCDPVRLRTQSLLTPACGLAAHDPSQVRVVLGLVRKVAERVQDQAYAARMSVGA